MNPAYSIIFFTTASGAGYGLLGVLGLYAWVGKLPDSLVFGALTMAVGVLLVTAGLVSSTYHLGHPERAWRALSQWRSSWLSREGVAAVVTFVPLLGLAGGWIAFGPESGTVRWAGLLSTVGCILTLGCTGMIYASLRAIPDWYSAWVPSNYLALGAMTGVLWLLVLAGVLGFNLPALTGWAPVVVGIAFVVKLAYWGRERAPMSTAESATGLDQFAGQRASVTPLDPPHTEENYLQREMGFVIARKHAIALREHTSLLAFALPLMLSILGLVLPSGASLGAYGLAAASATIGVVLERWLFFAEAKHVVTLYYDAAEV